MKKIFIILLLSLFSIHSALAEEQTSEQEIKTYKNYNIINERLEKILWEKKKHLSEKEYMHLLDTFDERVRKTIDDIETLGNNLNKSRENIKNLKIIRYLVVKEMEELVVNGFEEELDELITLLISDNTLDSGTTESGSLLENIPTIDFIEYSVDKAAQKIKISLLFSKEVKKVSANYYDSSWLLQTIEWKKGISGFFYSLEILWLIEWVDEVVVSYIDINENQGVENISIQGFTVTITWIGVVLENTDKGVLVKDVLVWKPAEVSWVQSGDIIQKIDGNIVYNYTDTVSLIKWEKWTEVKLSLLRDNKNIEITVKREEFEIFK